MDDDNNTKDLYDVTLEPCTQNVQKTDGIKIAFAVKLFTDLDWEASKELVFRRLWVSSKLSLQFL